MDIIIHRANTRGHANHGWLDTSHTFSFADYYDPQRMHFGALRVLNDDYVSGGMGFGTHPHDNMEIISIPLRGDLEHKDSMGNIQTIREGDIQVMSAGTGIRHSEYNRNKDEQVNFLQIWIFPKEKNIEPRYGQKKFDAEERVNSLQAIIAPERDSIETLWINQDAWMALSKPEAGNFQTYTLHKNGNGVYVFVIEGEIEIGENVLGKRDGAGITEPDSFEVKAKADSELLFIEVPMKL